MINFKVNPKYNNKKIVNVILNYFSHLTSSIVFKALRNKDILVNGKRIKDNILVYEGDEIIAYIQDNILTKLDIIYEDENILIANKPSGISVTKDSNSLICFSDIISQHCSNAMPCHRLDRNTSGLIIFAKNEESLHIMFQKFKNREIDKYYICLVYGIPKEKNKTIISYLFKDNKKSIVYISDTPKKGYQKIITKYSVISFNKENNTALLEVQIETGRTHQIRAHLAHIGYPIIGDRKIRH